MSKLPKSRFDPAKITGTYPLLGAFLLIVESVLIYWLSKASSSFERIFAGILITIIFIVFMVIVRQMNRTDSVPATVKEQYKAVCGRWDYRSESSHGTIRTGWCEISVQDGELSLAGNFSKDGKGVGSWQSQVARVRENRLIFYYVLNDNSDAGHQSVDAVTILVFQGEKPAQMEGDWIVVGKEKKYGRVDYTRSKPAAKG